MGPEDMRAAVVYYSCTGNTARLAELIHQSLKEKGIESANLRIKSPVSNRAFLKQGWDAFRRKKAVVEDVNFDLSGYDLVFMGSPVWAFSPAPPVNTYLAECQGLEGKSAVTFLTYGSGVGKGRAQGLIKKALLDKGAKKVTSIAVGEMGLRTNLAGVKRKVIKLIEELRSS